MNFLVIGGAGYIGSHAVDKLISDGYKVIVVDNLLTGHRDAVHSDAVFIEADIRNKDELDNVFKSYAVDAVFHFAASSLVGESVEKPLKYFDNNVTGMITLLESMRDNKIDKIIFSSSAAVYGEAETDLIDEKELTKPTSPYGESKLMMEKIIDWCDKAYGIKYVSLRYFNVAGAKVNGDIGEDHNPETHLIPLIIQTALEQREKMYIFGDDYSTPDGTCIRDYIHVEDLIRAHILAYHYLEAGNKSEVFNLGSSDGYSVKEIIDSAKFVTKKDFLTEIVQRRAGDPAKLVATSEKAKHKLGWEPEITNINDIILSAWEWFEKHPEGYSE